MLTPVDPSTTPAPQGGYTQGALVEGAQRWLFISGQIPVGPDGGVPATFGEQCRTAWRNVTDTLEVAGMGIDDLVKVTTYLADRADADENSAIRREVLGGHAPALTVVLAGIYDESWLLEIEAVAASPVTGSQVAG